MCCRKALTKEQLETAFTRSWAHKTLEGARRAALMRADQAHALTTQTTVMPLVRLYEGGALSAVLAAKAALKAEEERSTALQYKLWEAKRDVALGEGSNAALYAALRASKQEMCSQSQRVHVCKKQLKKSEEVAAALYDIIIGAGLTDVLITFRELLDTQGAALNDLNLGALAQSVMDQLGGAGAQLPPRGAAPEAAARAAEVASAPRLHPCSAQGCKGVFDGMAGTCMMCHALHCVRCIQPINGNAAEHHYNPDDVASAKYMAASTKPCPRCHTAISRLSGCAQMMCTHCNTVFDFNTGREVTGVIHNPHFYELSGEMRAKVVAERGPWSLIWRFWASASRRPAAARL